MQIAGLIRERGPMTVAAFMDLALYDSGFGYYARADQRSGRAGDFFTSVDVGPLFGELLEVQLAEMARVLAGLKTRATTVTGDPAVVAQDVGPVSNLSDVAQDVRPASNPSAVAHDFSPAFDLVEAGAGNGRLSADILRATRRRNPDFYASIRLHLVEASEAARAKARATLDGMPDRLVSLGPALPDRFEGVLIANELLDALPTHQVVMREDGLREVFVSVNASGRLVVVEGPPSTDKLAEYLDRLSIALEPGWRAEISLRAIEWMRAAARRLQRGFIVLIDYGHEARDLYSPAHAGGTLTSFARHTMSGPESLSDTPPWLHNPGDRDITAHVDFTSVRLAAEAEGLTTLGFLDQTYFLMGLIGSSGSGGPPNPLNPLNLLNSLNLSERLALKTLLMPGGLGSTHKVLILGKGVGTPSLAGCSFGMRVT